MGLILRGDKGSPLNHYELDGNFTYLEGLIGASASFKTINGESIIIEDPNDDNNIEIDNDIIIGETEIKDGMNKKLFYNDNGVFKEIPNFEYDIVDDVLTYIDNTRELGLIAGQQNIEVSPGVYMDFDTVGFFGKDNYSQGYVDLTSMGNGLIGQLGFGTSASFYGITAQKYPQDGVKVNIKAEESVNIDAEESVNIDAEENVSISALGDNSNLWANFGNENSVSTNISFTNRSVDGEFVFKSENGAFTIVDNSVSWDEKFRVDMINDLTILETGFKLGTNAMFGQQFQTGQGYTVDDLITVLQNMGILKQ